MQSRITDFTDAGTQVLAISPDTLDWNEKVSAKLGRGFPILRDDGLEVSRLYGVEDADAMNPAGEGGIPRPATFVLDRDGVVRWRHFTENWRVRPRVDQVLEAVRSVN